MSCCRFQNNLLILRHQWITLTVNELRPSHKRQWNKWAFGHSIHGVRQYAIVANDLAICLVAVWHTTDRRTIIFIAHTVCNSNRQQCSTEYAAKLQLRKGRCPSDGQRIIFIEICYKDSWYAFRREYQRSDCPVECYCWLRLFERRKLADTVHREHRCSSGSAAQRVVSFSARIADINWDGWGE